MYTRNIQQTERKAQAGFTLIELLVSIGILAILATAGWLVSLDVYYGFMLHSERNHVLSLLHRARSGAMHRTHGGTERVCLVGNQYVLASGNDCTTPANILATIDRNQSVAVTWPGDIVFQPLSGRTGNAVVTFTARARSLSLNLNSEGRID